MDKQALMRGDGNPAPDLFTTCQVLLGDIEIMADIGVFEHERGVPQPLRIDVTLTVVPPVHDELAETFDYSRIPVFARELAARHIALIETFALQLARMCLACDTVLEAEVRIGKPRAVPGCLAGTRIVLSKCRAGDSSRRLAATSATDRA